MDVEALFADCWFGLGPKTSPSSHPQAQPSAGRAASGAAGPPLRASLEQSVCSTAASVGDEDDIYATVPSALTVTPAWGGIASSWRRALRAVARDVPAGGPPPPPLAPPLAPLVLPGSGERRNDHSGAHRGGGSSSSEPPSPMSVPGGAAAGSGHSTPLLPPASPCSPLPASCGKVAVPLGRAALMAVFKHTSFSAPPLARPEESLAAAPSGGEADPAAACAAAAASAAPASTCHAVAASAPLRPAQPLGQQAVPAVRWNSAFGAPAAAAAAAPAAVQSWPLEDPNSEEEQQAEAQQQAKQRQQQKQPKQHQQQEQLKQRHQVPSPSQQDAQDGGPSEMQRKAAAHADPSPATAASDASPSSLAAPAAAPPAAGDADVVAWRYLFTSKWRRARHVAPIDRFNDSPDPLAFISAHGAATTVSLATAAGPSAASRGDGAPAAGAPRKPPSASPSPLPRPPSGGNLRGGRAAAAPPSRGCSSGASSLAGSVPTMPRVFSGGEMHRQLVAEARRAHAALELHNAAQRAAGDAGAGARRPAADEAPRPWAGPLVPAVRLDPAAVSNDAFVLARLVDASAPPGLGRCKLVLRAARGAAPGKLLAELEGEVAAAAAAARLPAPYAEVQPVGRGALFLAGPRRLKVVPSQEPAPRGAMVPAAVASLAAALLRQAVPAEWAVLH
ncbi:hypothetical protein Rsub_00135 [Raphidocelis subcapitata]|uniref:Uncharacterized protein n=1 Tax=Raphidocelis subcapitata TaxID=307507 RepID=A0A2V0NJM1_9CHLO|nr:hypothetical protein Rsub_00135 [Raphidocelis subcapitata]|eukprot:GBF87424.1 hypothetical protein Rsub_00135 [Raphidocelis subcapitata]